MTPETTFWAGTIFIFAVGIIGSILLEIDSRRHPDYWVIEIDDNTQHTTEKETETHQKGTAA